MRSPFARRRRELHVRCNLPIMTVLSTSNQSGGIHASIGDGGDGGDILGSTRVYCIKQLARHHPITVPGPHGIILKTRTEPLEWRLLLFARCTALNLAAGRLMPCRVTAAVLAAPALKLHAFRHDRPCPELHSKAPLSPDHRELSSPPSIQTTNHPHQS